MSGNHTPTPWRIDEYHSVIGPDGKEIHANGFSSIMSYGPAMLDARANAELIVTAVNSYASSQAEIERLRTALQTIASRADGYSHGDDHVTAAFAGIANVALAALSGSEP